MNSMDKTERIISEALYTVENKATVRETGRMFNMSKSAIHNDLSKTLKKLNYSLYIKVKEVLDINTLERASRGGQATKATKALKKYLRLNKEK